MKDDEIKTLETIQFDRIIIWLGIVNLFQTFEDLESVKDKQAELKAIRQLLDDEE